MQRNIKLLLLASILIHSATNLFAPVYAIFIKQIGGTLLDAGIAIGIYALLKGIFYFIFDRVDETKFSKKLMMFLGYSIMGLGYIGYIFAGKPMHIFIIQAVLSVGEVIITPSWSAVIAINLNEGKERHIYSHFYGYRSIFEGGAAMIGGLLALKFGFDTIFIIMAVFAVMAAAVSLMVTDNDRRFSDRKLAK